MSESANDIVDTILKEVFGKFSKPSDSLDEAIKQNDAEWREAMRTVSVRAANAEAEVEALVEKAEGWAVELADASQRIETLEARLRHYESSHDDTLSEMPAAPLASTVDVSDFGQVGE